MLPNALEWVLEMCGFEWPTGDEDKMMECANTWRQFAADVQSLQVRGVSAAGNVLAENAGDSIEGFNKTWEKFGGGSGYFDDARQGAELIAICLDAAAMLIIGLKVAVIAQLVILAVEIIAAQAAAPFTLGLSELGALGAAAATRMILRKLLKEVAQQILQAVLETAKEPFVSALEAMVSDLVAQTVEQNFGKQSGYDLGRTAKKGYEEGKEALKNSGSTFGESLRDGAGSRAGHGARHGLTHGGNEGGDGGGDGSSDSGNGGGTDGSPKSNDAPSNGSSPSDNTSSSNDSGASGNSPSSSPSANSAGSAGSANSSGSSASPSDDSSSSGNSPSSSNAPSSSSGDSGRRAPDIGGPSSSSPSSGPDSSSSSPSSSSIPSSSSGPSSSSDGPSASNPSSSSASSPSRGSDAPSPFDVGTHAYNESISRPPGDDSPSPGASPDSPTPAPAATTRADVEGGPAPDTTPDSGRPDSTPDVPPSTAPGTEPSTPANSSSVEGPVTTPDGDGSPSPSTSIPEPRHTEPAPMPSPPPETDRPEAAPAPAPASESSRPEPGVHQVDRDSGATTPAPAQGPVPGDSGNSNTDDHQNQRGGRVSMPSGAMPGNTPTGHPSPGQGHVPTPSTPTPHSPDDDSLGLMGNAATAAPPATGTQPGETGIPQQTAPSPATPSTPPPGAMPPPTAGPVPTQAPAAGTPTSTPRATRPSGTTSRTEQPSTRPTTPSRDTRQNRPASALRTETPGRPATPPRDGQPTNRPTDQRPPAESPTPTPHDQGMPAPNNQQPDHQQPDATNQTSDQNQPPADDGAPKQPTAPPPPPQADSLSDIRDNLNIPFEGLTTPDPAHQQDLENAHPRNPDGTPQVYADPRQGNWAALQNDGGVGVPGRSNNCADCTRSFLETWFGRPTVSAPRTLDLNADGSLNTFSAERDSVDNQARWAGAPSTYAGKDHPNPYARIAYELSQAGHGSAAVIGVNWPGGGGHAFAAVNHNGQVLFVDAQTGVVSEHPIHLGAQEVFYTPLDANRNPITPYFLTPSTPQPSAQSTPDSNTPQESRPDQAPETAPDTDATPGRTAETEPAQDPDATDQDSPQPDNAQDTQDSQETQGPHDADQQAESREPVFPSTATRPSGPPDGYDDPTDADNRAQRERFPRNEDGSFQQAPDPREGTWVDDLRGRHPDESGRDVNCPDASLAFVESYAGNPTVAARRSANEDGTPADTPEPNGRDRIENALGAEFDDFGDGPEAYRNLESTLLGEGHGAQAVIITQNADGRAHAWNVVNHNGQIVYADPQTGRHGTTPLHSGDNGVFAIPLDAGRRPVETTNPPTTQNQPTPQPQPQPNTQTQNGTTPADTAHSAPERPAGTPPESDPSAEATRERRNQSLPDPEARTDAHAGLPPDQAQGDLRDAHDVHRIGLDPVQAQMRQWAQPQGDPPRVPLADVLRESIGRRQAHAESAQSVREARHDYDRALKEVADAKAERTRAATAERKAKTDDAKQAAQAKRAAAEQRLAQAQQALPQADAAHKAAMAAHRAVPMPATNFTDSDLRQHLDPAWSRMDDGQRYAAIAALARISQSFHANNAVGVNPDPAAHNDTYDNGKFHESAAPWRREIASHPDGTNLRDVEDLKRLLEETESNAPDFSGKNYAVVEVFDPNTGESHYIVDSSVPPAVDGADPMHSESHILNWIDQLNENREARAQTKVEVKGLYTEREPCGLPNTASGHPTGHANCSRTINDSRAMDGVPVYYSTTYRADPGLKGLKAAERDRLRAEGKTESQIRTALSKYRTPSQQAQDREIQQHLKFVNDLAKALANPGQNTPPAPTPDQNTPPTQAPQSGPSHPTTGPDRTPPSNPAGTAGTDRRPPADPSDTPAPSADEPREGSPASEDQPKRPGRLKQMWQSLTHSVPDEPTELTTEVDQPRFGNHKKLPELQPDRYGTPLDRPDGTRVPLFDGPPSREQTQQGGIGDCGIIATLGAIASRYPDLLQDMIRETEDGNYEVRFHEVRRNKYGNQAPTGRILTVRVTPEVPVYSDFPNTTAYANANDTGVAWPAIMEKAIAGLDQFWDDKKRENELQFPGSKDFDGNLLTGYSRIGQGSTSGDRAELLAQLTGRTAENHDFPTHYDMNGRSPEKQLLAHLRELTESGRPVVIGTRPQGKGVENRMAKGLLSSHAYEIVSVDEKGLIQLRNPHNEDDPEPLAIKEFMKYCSNQYASLEDEK
ncbi:toxin glutamine deamidase domain-containing protein [Streptomyces chrestomyceticus]|uniref:toxin glutamine deamidase domain-containing protein n=1 Tax=Streptomyces chrestomyceticus TaxID=68185 RepID=UPI00378DE173